jgi:PAS domain S-box-containing protein
MRAKSKAPRARPLKPRSSRAEAAPRHRRSRSAERRARPADKAQEQSRFLQAFFAHSLDSLVLLDKKFNFIRVNEVYARACQRKVSDFPGHNHFEFYPNSENQAIFERVVRTKRSYQVQSKPFVFAEHPDWGVTYWDWTLVPVLDRHGQVDFLVFSLRDVTLRKRIQKTLQENEERYRSLVTATAQIVWTTSAHGEVVQELPTWQGFTGQSRQQYQGSGWTEAVHPDDRQAAAAAWSHAVATRTLYEAEYRLRRHDGVYRYVTVRGVPVLERNREIREWVGTCTDITEQKQAERRREVTNALLGLFAQKATSKEYLDAVVNILREWSGCQAVGIKIVGEDKHVAYESRVGFDNAFLEAEQGEAQGNCCCVRTIAQAFDEADRSLVTPGGSFRCEDSQAYCQRLAPEEQARFRNNCVEFGFASVAVVPLRHREKLFGAVHLADRRAGVFPLAMIEFIESMAPLIAEAIHRFQAETELAHYRDRLEHLVKQRTSDLEATNSRLQIEVGERKRAQEILQQTTRELQRSNRDLEQFAYIASHDLQEPLRAVGGYVRLLQLRFPEAMDPKAVEFIDGAAEGASRMERLITDLLAFSRVGTQAGAFVSCNFNELLTRALYNLQTGIRAAQATVTSNPLPVTLADPTQMVQVLQNLIGNAIKFHGASPPDIRLDTRQDERHWIFSVKDNGIGIESRYFERIFQIFQRLHTRKHYPGTGMGLAICKKIVERHGGSIWVESQPGSGSTFYFSISKTPVISPAVL